MAPKTVLKSLITLSKDGEWGKEQEIPESVKMGVIRGTDFEDVALSDLTCLPQRYIPKHIAEVKRLQPGDIIIETAGGSKDRPTGRTLFIKETVISRSTLPLTCASFSRFIRIDSSKANPRFLFYLLQHMYLVGYTRKYNTQHTGVARFQWTLFAENEELRIPEIETQKKIASVLSAYDDLIENNSRRIELLERMAKLVYDEWFVKYKFPGHEKMNMIESENGRIPEGWEVKRLGDACSITMGQSPKSEFYNETGEGLPFHQGVTNFGDRFPRDGLYCTTPNRIAEANDILFSVRAPVGRINIANKKIIIGRGLCAIRSRTRNQEFMFQQLKHQFKEEDSMGGGTIFNSVTKEDMYNIKVVVPASSVVNPFEEVIKPIFRNIEVLTTKNENLRLTRDLLLPRLVSGEVAI